MKKKTLITNYLQALNTGEKSPAQKNILNRITKIETPNFSIRHTIETQESPFQSLSKEGSIDRLERYKVKEQEKKTV